ncbi:MAG: beta-ketoacyl synthase N-terminal-like domain-containing protein [Kiritimatiellia bacterium]
MEMHTDSVVFTGVSGCFGGASTSRAFWKALLRKQSFFVPFGETADAHFSDDLFPKHIMPEVCSALGANFACRADQIPLPTDLGIGDNPDFYFAAQLAYDALADAGISPGNEGTDRIAIFLGYESAFNPAAINWIQHASGIEQLMSTLQRFFPNASYAQMATLRAELASTLPLLKPRQLEHARGEGIVRGLTQIFNACDMACLCSAGEASVFAGLDAAMNSLSMHQCDAAVVLVLQPPILQAQLAGEAVMTPFSTCHALLPYTSTTQGTLPGEGGAAFVLRRHSDAQAQNKHCYARLHGCGLVSGITPTLSLQEQLTETLRRTLHRSLRRLPNGFRDIDYWEMNGSGVPIEDAAEEALLNRITANRGAHIPLLALGSAKSSFGNTFTAAGAVGILKGLLALNYRVLPPSVTPVDESFRLRLPEQAYYWVQEARPWIASSMRPRRLIVSTLSHLGRAGSAVLEAMP